MKFALALLFGTVMGSFGLASPTETSNKNVPVDYALQHEKNALVGRQSPFPMHRIAVSVGDQRQHVGYLVGVNLHREIRRCLDILCKPGIRDCTPEIPGATVKPITCRINNIAYSAEGHLSRASHLIITVHKYYWTADWLRELMVDVVAWTFAAMTHPSSLENSYQVLPDGKWERMWTVGHNVKVKIDSAFLYTDPPLERPPELEVGLAFYGKTTEGDFDCAGSKTPIIHALRENGMMDRINAETSEAKRPIEEWIDCTSRPHRLHHQVRGLVPNNEVTIQSRLPRMETVAQNFRKLYPRAKSIDGADGQTSLPASSSSLEKRAANMKRSVRTIHMRYGAQRQHAGELRGQQMWNEVNACLIRLCPKGQSGHGVCDEGACKIGSIGYNNGKGKLETNAHVDVRVTFVYIPKGKEGLRDAMIELIAGVFKTFTEEEGNCYELKLSGSQRKMCNVPHVVLVHVDHLAWMHVTFYFNGQTLEGPLDCDKTIPATNKFLDGHVREDFAKALSLPVDQLGSYAACQAAWDCGCRDKSICDCRDDPWIPKETVQVPEPIGP